MAYRYLTSELVTDITNRLKDLRPAPLVARWNEDLVRDAIKEGLKWADPLGEISVVTMTPVEYAAASQPDVDVLEIRKVEVSSTRGWIVVPSELWRLERHDPAWLTLVNAPTTESLRITALCRYDTTSIAEKVSGSYPVTYIHADPIMISLYAMSVLLEGDVNYGLPSQTITDETHLLDFRTQAELRKQVLLLQQNPPPPPQPEQRSRSRR